LEDRCTVIERLTEVAAREASDETAVLRPKRLVETELLADRVDIRLVGARLHEKHRWIAGNAHEEEDGQR